VRIHLEGDNSLSKQEMASLVYGQLTAGHETTTALLSIGLLELLRQHDQWEAVCEDPSLIPGAVEELLRIGSPVFAWKRRTKRPAQVAGVDIPADQNVLLLLGSANHDERQFPDPERLDVRRANARQHVAFGGGVHFCLGAPLARLEARIVLEELTARLPGLRLVEGETVTFGENSTFRGPASLLVEWEPAPLAHG
jgi:cytochrome P450